MMNIGRNDLNFYSKIISGFPAVVYQHEIDHLDGILFTDKVYNNKSLVSYQNYQNYHEKKYLERIEERFSKDKY